MAQPMLEIKPDKAAPIAARVTPNLLPCRVHHTGSAEPAETFWNPGPDKEGHNTSYFRGRKLRGKTVKLPAGYRGVVAETVRRGGEENVGRGPRTDGLEPIVADADVDVDADGLLVRAEFDELVVWGHGAVVADATADPYVRGVEEWLAFASQIHSYSSEK